MDYNAELLEAAFDVDLAPEMKLALIFLALQADPEGMVPVDDTFDVRMARFMSVPIFQAQTWQRHLDLTGYTKPARDGSLLLVAERLARS